MNFKKRTGRPTNTKNHIIFWKTIDPTKTQGFEVEVIKNTFKTYDNFVMSGSVTKNGSFFTLDSSNIHASLGSKPIKNKGESFKTSGLGQENHKNNEEQASSVGSFIRRNNQDKK